MPQVIYRGRWPTKRTSFGDFTRGKPQDVEQEWLDTHALRLVGNPDFVVIGNEAVEDAPSANAEPDTGWTRVQIYDWLTLRDVRARAGLTKPQLLKVVRGSLGIEDDEEEDESAEDSMNAPAVDADMAAEDNDDIEQEVAE